jgi:hypothetical protein
MGEAMTGPEHFREAEHHLMAVTKPDGYGGHVVAGDANPNVIAVAQVHATLALAAATALNQDGTGMLRTDRQAWHAAAGAADRPPGPPRPVPPSGP